MYLYFTIFFLLLAKRKNVGFSTFLLSHKQSIPIGRNIPCMAYMLYIYPWTNISDNVMPYCKTYTETVVAVTVPIVVVEVEYSCIGSIVIVTTTFEERFVRIDKVSIIVWQVYPMLFAQALLERKVLIIYFHYLYLV